MSAKHSVEYLAARKLLLTSELEILARMSRSVVLQLAVAPQRTYLPLDLHTEALRLMREAEAQLAKFQDLMEG